MNEEPPDHLPDQRAFDGLLHESLRIDEAVDESFVKRVVGSLPQGRKIPRKFFLGTAIAACLALFVVLKVVLRTYPDAVASLEEIHGEIVVDRGGGLIALKSGDPIFDGDRVRCPPGGRTTVRYPDGTKLEVNEARLVIATGKGEQKKVTLESGAAFCSVAPQPESAPLLFETPHGRGEVLGTVFQLRIDDNSTRLQTVHGKVRVRNQSEDWTSINEGYFVSLKPSGSLVARTMNAENYGPGDIVWFQEFGTEYGGEADLEGEQIQFTENGQLVSAMRSRDAIITSPKWRPDAWIGIELESREALFPTREDMEIVLRLRSQRVGEFRVTLIPENRLFKQEHVISGAHPLSSKWTEVTLQLKDFKPHRGSREIDAGLLMRAISIWGFDCGEILLDRVLVRRASSIM